ncbi:MAG: hypothetical protein LBR80_14810 [Deltaproteobacteria bacterium]|jgi:hypothetical protein|nr:hypothetical protein [Deltaproteobacteria bacterium]
MSVDAALAVRDPIALLLARMNALRLFIFSLGLTAKLSRSRSFMCELMLCLVLECLNSTTSSPKRPQIPLPRMLNFA